MDMACVAALVGAVGVSLQAHPQPERHGRRDDGRASQQGREKGRSSIPARILWLQPLHPVVVAGMGKSIASCQKE